MVQVLVLEDNEMEFTDFDKAVDYIEEEYGYEGAYWEIVKSDKTFERLHDFLAEDGINSEVQLMSEKDLKQ